MVTLTVIPSPDVTFTTISPVRKTSLANQNRDYGVTFRAASNVAIVLDFKDRRQRLEPDSVGKDATITLTSKEFKNISKIEIIYLGN